MLQAASAITMQTMTPSALLLAAALTGASATPGFDVNSDAVWYRNRVTRDVQWSKCVSRAARIGGWGGEVVADRAGHPICPQPLPFEPHSTRMCRPISVAPLCDGSIAMGGCA